MVNGPQTSATGSTTYTIDNSRYNAKIDILPCRTKGQSAAMDAIAKLAQEKSIERIFFTDADIYRFPHSLLALWNSHNRSLTGAAHYVYPVEIARKSTSMSAQEAFLYELFEIDKHPLIRNILDEAHLSGKRKIKSSLMLVDTDFATTMHSGVNITSDSVIFQKTAADQSTLVD